jgi:Xaa-Pro aminopeptidase
MKRPVMRTALFALPVAVLAAASFIAPRSAAAQPASTGARAGSGGPQPHPSPAASPLDPYASPASASGSGGPGGPGPGAPAAPSRRPQPSTAPAAPRGAGPASPGPADPYAQPGDPAARPGDPARAGATTAAGAQPADPYARPGDPATPIPRRVGLADVPAVQGLLAVQRLDGWLLFDRDGENPIAERLVAPDGHPTRPWFYMIPARGAPIALVHSTELRSFDHLAGTKLTYQGYRDLDKQLRAMLKGVKSVAVEYSAKAAVPAVSRVDAGTLEVIRAAGVQVRSSDTLVQFTKAIWGDAGRTAHYVAVHHVVELRKEALAFVAKRLHGGEPVTERDVQQEIVRGMTMRGLVGPPPVVAAGVNTADPYYVPSADKAAPIKRGDLIVISLAARLDQPEGIYAAQTWCAVADQAVPEPIARAFETVSLARDQAMALIGDRARKHRPVTGAEVDDTTRAFLRKAGLADRVMHRTGHSIDNDLQGGGADLDDFEVKDSRILTPGTGVTIGPGVYFAGQFGVRSEVSVYLAPGGPEITTPAQDEVEALLKP